MDDGAPATPTTPEDPPDPPDDDAPATSGAASADGRSRRARVTARVADVEQRASDQAAALEGRVPHLSLIRELWQRYRSQNATVLAGHLAFRSFLFLLPIAVLVVAMLGFADGTVDVSDQAGNLGISRSLSRQIAQGATEAHQGRVALLASGLFALALTGLGLLSALHYCFAQAWGLEPGKLRRKASLLPKFVGSVIIVVLAIVGVGALRRLGLAASYAGVLLAALIVGVAFLGINLVLPRRATSWQWLVPGSVAATAGIIGLQIFATFYLPAKIARSSSLYGSLGVAVAVLFYLFLLGNVIVGSALVNAVWWDHFHGPAVTAAALERLPDPPDPAGAPGSVEDDHVVAD